MKRILSLFLFSFTYILAFAQADFGITAYGGVSKIVADMRSSETVQKFYFAPTGGGGLYYNTYFWEKSYLGAALYFSQIEGKERSTTPEKNSSGTPNGLYITSDTWRYISCWSAAFNYGYGYEKMNFNLGAQFDIIQRSGGRSKTEIRYNNGTVFTSNESVDRLPIDDVDYSIRAGIVYNLSKKIAMEAVYIHTLTNIYASNNWKWNFQQIVFGVHYNFVSHLPKNEVSIPEK